MINRSLFGALALALVAGPAMAAAPDHRMGHGRVRPGMFPGITFEPDNGDGKGGAPAAPGGAEAKTLGEAVTLFVQARDRYDEEAKRFGTVSQETKNNIEALQEQLSKLEVAVKGNRPAPGKPGAKGQEEGDLETKAFVGYMRRGEKGLSADEQKALTTDSDTDGGFFVPTNIDRNVREKLILISPVRELADVVTISQGDTMEIPLEDEASDPTFGWVGEREARPETGTPKTRSVKITAHEMYAKPKISQKLLDDSAYNVESWLNGRLTKRFAQAEGAAFINGTGEGQPLGLLNNAAGISYYANGHASVLQADALIGMFYDLPEEYAALATWLLRRKTVGVVRMLKDNQGQYLWQPGLTADQPGVILGRPYREANDMPDVAAGAFPVLFGDFAAAYTVVDRQGVRVLRDPFSSKPLIEFYTTRRVGGAVVQKEAMRKLKISVS